MNNLFKKGLASIALASAMTSSVFSGNAAYIDVRVNYLSGTGKAVLGYDGSANKEKVELYIRVLDKDGNFADKDNSGANLINMKISRSGNAVDNYSASGNVGTTTSNIVSRGVISASDDDSLAIADKNAARYTLDYTEHDTASLLDSLHITAGNLGKGIKVNLSSIDAKGLIVRITTRDILSSTGGIFNEKFTNIKVSGAGNLSVQATELPQATVGQKIPLRIYASNLALSTNENNPSNPSEGRFTSSDAFDGKTIVVVAVGDYNVSGTTGTYISQTDLIMNQGIAKGSIVVNYGLPEKNGTSGVNGNTKFGTANVGGLGVAFIAYMKDKPSVSNNGNIALSNGVLRTDKTQNLAIAGNDNDTDSLKVKSGLITGFKVGKFVTTNARNMASGYFSDDSNVFIANGAGLNGTGTNVDVDENLSIIAVDKFGNPGTIITAIDKTVGPTKVTISGEEDVNDYNQTILVDRKGSSFSIKGSGGDNNLTTDLATGITQAFFDIEDANNTSGKSPATKKTVKISFKTGELEGTTPAVFTVTTLDLVGETPSAIKGDLSGEINVTITGNQVLYTEHAKEGDKSDMKIYVKIDKVNDNDNGDDNITLTIKTLDSEGEVDNKITFTNTAYGGNTAYATSTTFGSKVDINASVSKTITIGGGITGTINFFEFNASNLDDYKSKVGSTTVITLKGSANSNNPSGDNNLSHRQYVDAYVKTTISTKGAEDFVDSTSETGRPGQVIIDFDFSGDFISQNVGNAKATIAFSAGDDGNASNTSNILVGLVGQKLSTASTIDRAANNATISSATIPSSGRLSVVLYQVETADNKPESLKTPYMINSIKINGFNIVTTSRRGNELTKAIDVAVDGGDNNVTINMAAGFKKTATKVSINSIGTTGLGEGGSTDKAATLPSAGDNAILGSSFSATTSEAKTDSSVKVLTNTYYTLFDRPANLTVQDAYGNRVNMEETALGDNYTLTTSDAECAIVKMNDGSETEPATIFFKDCAAGKEISVIITAKGSLEENDASNKITFTNIARSLENTKFDISINVGSETYNVANNDVIIKIVGDGNTQTEKASIVVTSENKDAKIVLRPVPLLSGGVFTSLVSDGKLSATIEPSGNYYVIRSDLKGKVTVKVDAVIPKAEAKSKKDTPITGSLSFDVTLVDLVAPTAVVKATSGGLTLTITDVSLNETATTVEVYKDGVMLKALTGSKGVYTTKVPKGLYSVKVHAEDVSGNILNKSYPILVGKAGTSAKIEDSLIAKGTYEIAGTFSSYDFADKDAAFDWVYTDNEGVSYQLLGDTPTAEQPFGWKETDVKTTSKDWYMIKLTGDDEGPFGWVLINKDTNAAFKLQGAKADHTFEFSGALYLKATVSESSVKFTKK